MARPRAPRRPLRRSDETGSQPRFAGELPSLPRLGLLLALSALISALMVDWFPRAGSAGLQEGDIAPTDIRAPRVFSVVDETLTREKREVARAAVAPVFEHDVLLVTNILRRVDRAFEDMRRFLLEAQGAGAPAPLPGGDAPDRDAPDRDADVEGEGASPAPGLDPAALGEQLVRFESTLGLDLRDVDEATLRSVGFGVDTQRDIKELVRVAMAEYIVLDLARLPSSGGLLVTRVEGSRRTEVPLTDTSTVRDLRAARDLVSRTAAADFSDRAPHVYETVVYAARELTTPNLRFNASETEVRREMAASAVQPVRTDYRRGQVILRAGEPVTAWTIQVIEAMSASRTGYHPALHLATLTLLLALVLATVVRFSERWIEGFRHRLPDLATMAALLLLVALLAGVLHAVGAALQQAFPRIPLTAYGYLIPAATGAIIVRTLMNGATAMVWASAAALLGAAVYDGGLNLAVFLLASAAAGAGGLGSAHERGGMVRAGAVAALTNGVVVVAIDLVRLAGLEGVFWGAGSEALTDVLFHVLFALVGGIVAGVLALGMSPMFESLGYVTRSRLLELSNLNHPLLRDMIVKAPGTYHHSMMVGSLAEAAAEAIAADSLLVRVGAYFHDIGKMLKPQYFIENQQDLENPHDRLTPSMSGLVIVNHVKEGIELGRSHGLPEPIIDMIPQHHGTSLVSFFYNKAVQTADPDKQEIEETDYRYPGPKPQTKEAAIMMLADCVEAATRSLKTHTAGTISTRVQAMVNRVVADGQLDECPLTLADVHTISETFVQVLLGIHHHRIEYPKPPGGAPAKGGRPRGVPAKNITLEIPNKTPTPGAPHPLAREDDVHSTGERPASGTGRGEGSNGKDTARDG